MAAAASLCAAQECVPGHQEFVTAHPYCHVNTLPALHPFDQQSPWLHGQHRRVPAMGGFSSFRPYNWRHVAAQAHIASGWGTVYGQPYTFRPDIRLRAVDPVRSH